MIAELFLSALMSVDHTFTVNLQVMNGGQETHFVLEERGPFDESFQPIVEIGAADRVVCVDVSGNPGDQFTYRIAGYNGESLIAYSNEMVETIPNPVPIAPSNLTITFRSRSEIVIAWTDNSDNEERFIIRRRNRSSATVGANVTSYRDRNLRRNTTYCYTVASANAAGESVPTNEICGRTTR